MSDVALLTYKGMGRKFYADKELAAKMVVAYDDVTMEVVEDEDLPKLKKGEEN